MKMNFKCEYLAPAIWVANIALEETFLNASGGFTLSNDKVTSGDSDDVWDE